MDMNKPLPWDAEDIGQLLPHRYPFLLVDRVTHIEPFEYAIGYQNISITNLVFQGHFPHKAIYPGVLILEALAQVGAVLGMASMKMKPTDNELYTLCSFDQVRFKRPVVPGDQLELKTELDNRKRNFWRFKGEARVDGTLVSQASILCATVGLAQL